MVYNRKKSALFHSSVVYYDYSPSDTVPSELEDFSSRTEVCWAVLDGTALAGPRLRFAGAVVGSLGWFQRCVMLTTSLWHKLRSMCHGKKHLTHNLAPHPVQNVLGLDAAPRPPVVRSRLHCAHVVGSQAFTVCRLNLSRCSVEAKK